MKSVSNKWICGAIPALLIHCSIGSVYCWSTFKEAIANTIGMSQFSVGWAFSLAIFFLGMSAAFGGRFVEKNIHRSSLVSAICFAVGMAGTGFFISYTTGKLALIGIYLCYGVIMGIGLGIGYITPVKTLMLWFPKQKGLATGISIMGFGLAKAIATPIMEYLQAHGGLAMMFYKLALAYFILMMISHIILKKPSWWKEEDVKDTGWKLGPMFRDKTFIGIWLMFYINIHCGLALISYEKQILNTAFSDSVNLALIVAIVPSITAAFNALGRLGYSTISDKMKDRNTVYKIIFLSSWFITIFTLLTKSITNPINPILGAVCVITLLIVVNAGYGGGFSTLPSLLQSRYGMEHISTIHGAALSAWAIAGISGNNSSELILQFGGQSYTGVLIMTTILYFVAFLISNYMIAPQKK